MSKKLSVINTKSNNTKTKMKKDSQKKKSSVAIMSRRPRGALSMESLRIKRYELWDEFSIGTGDNTYRKNFDTSTGPSWFKAMANLYEMYQIHNIRMFIKPTAATTNSGGWVAAYNTNYAERSATRSAGAISAQLGSGGNTIFKNGLVFIPASALKGFSTNMPLRSDNNGWSFNLELLTTGVTAACSIKVYIEYDITFRNPQLN